MSNRRSTSLAGRSRIVVIRSFRLHYAPSAKRLSRTFPVLSEFGYSQSIAPTARSQST